MNDTKQETPQKMTIKESFALLLAVVFVMLIVWALFWGNSDKDAAMCDTANTAYSAAYLDYEITLRKAQNMLTASGAQRLDTHIRETLENLAKTRLQKTPDVVCGFEGNDIVVGKRNAETRDLTKATIRLKEALLNVENTTDR